MDLADLIRLIHRIRVLNHKLKTMTEQRINQTEYLYFKRLSHSSQIIQAIAMQDREILRELSAPSLLDLMDDISNQAEANGLTPKILESILSHQ